MSEPTCQERIGEYYASRMKTIGALVKAVSINEIDELTEDEMTEILDGASYEARSAGDADTIRETASDQIYEMPLSVEVVRIVKITLGTGGPGDWFEAMVDEDGAIGRIEYHFNDWFDHAEINVSDDDDARAFCEQFTESALLQ